MSGEGRVLKVRITEPCLVVDVKSPAEGAQPPSAFSGSWWHPRPPPWEVTATWLRPRRHPGRYVRLSTHTRPSGVWFPVRSPTKPLILLFHFWATLLDYSHFLPLYTSTFLKFAGEFCTFDSTTLIWLLMLPVALQITSCKVTISSNKCTFDTISMGDIYFYQIYKHNIFTYSTRITSGYFLQLITCFTSKQIKTFLFLPPASQPWSNQFILNTYCTKSLIWIKAFNSMFLLHFMLFYFSIICFHGTYVFNLIPYLVYFCSFQPLFSGKKKKKKE